MIAFGLKPVGQIGTTRPAALQVDRVSTRGNLFVRWERRISNRLAPEREMTIG